VAKEIKIIILSQNDLADPTSSTIVARWAYQVSYAVSRSTRGMERPSERSSSRSREQWSSCRVPILRQSGYVGAFL